MDNKEKVITNQPDNTLNSNNQPISDAKANKVDSNNTFFEKFERTKKDAIKEKKQAKLRASRSVKVKNRILGFENKLRDDEFIKNSWIVFITLTIFFLAYASVCLGFLATSFNGTTDPKWSFAQHYSEMTQTIVIFSSVILILVPLPYIYLMGMWFVGINGAHKNKGFFIANFVILLISLVLLLVVIPLSGFIFAKVNGFVPFDIPVEGGDGGTETPPENENPASLNAFYALKTYISCYV